MTKRYDFPNNKFTKMLRFFLVVEVYGLIYPHPLGENSSFAYPKPSEAPTTVFVEESIQTKTNKKLITTTIMDNNRIFNQEQFQGSLRKIMCCFPILVTLSYFSG